jgi:hypothetical protein
MSLQRVDKPVTLRDHIRFALEMDAQRPIHFMPDGICHHLQYGTKSLFAKQWRRLEVTIEDADFAKILVSILEQLTSDERSRIQERGATKIGWAYDTTNYNALVIQCILASNEEYPLLEKILYNAIVQAGYNRGIQSTRDRIVSIHRAIGGVDIQRQSPWHPIFEMMRARTKDENGRSGITFNHLIDSYLCASEWVEMGTVQFYSYSVEKKKKKESIVWIPVKKVALSDIFLFKNEKENEKIKIARDRKYIM